MCERVRHQPPDADRVVASPWPVSGEPAAVTPMARALSHVEGRWRGRPEHRVSSQQGVPGGREAGGGGRGRRVQGLANRANGRVACMSTTR